MFPERVTLSLRIDIVIQRLRRPHYHTIDNSEASIRVAIELLILDRLHHFSDGGALGRLQL